MDGSGDLVDAHISEFEAFSARQALGHWGEIRSFTLGDCAEGKLEELMELASLYFDVAQICPKGHVINATWNHCRAASEDCCEDHGIETKTTCPNGHFIRGVAVDKKNKPAEDPFSFKAPRYCWKCGVAHPWTAEKLQKLGQKVTVLAKEDGFSEEDARAFGESIPDMGGSEAKSEGVFQRIGAFLHKLSPDRRKTVFDSVCKVGSDVATAAIKAHLGLK